jgi:hypothetical protein
VPFDCADLVKQNLEFYWADADLQRQLDVFVTVNGNCVHRFLKMDVKSPLWDGLAILQDIARVDSEETYMGLLPLSLGGKGIIFGGSVLEPTGYDFANGAWRLAQLVNPYHHKVDTAGNIYDFPSNPGVWGLDNAWPYRGTRTPYRPPWRTWPSDGQWCEGYDTPHTGLKDTYNTAVLNDHFRTWMMYQPPGIGSSWVPLASVRWHVTIAKVEINYEWQYPGEAAFDPDSGPFCAFERTTEFPEWSIVHHNPARTQNHDLEDDLSA